MPLSGRVLVYVIDHDLGFAPNPFHGVCSLAACKPRIRSSAQIGDVIVGLGSKKNGLQGRMIYWMRVSEITRFDHYWNDTRFRHKKPDMRGSLLKRYGNNIFARTAWGPSFWLTPSTASRMEYPAPAISKRTPGTRTRFSSATISRISGAWRPKYRLNSKSSSGDGKGISVDFPAVSGQSFSIGYSIAEIAGSSAFQATGRFRRSGLDPPQQACHVDRARWHRVAGPRFSWSLALDRAIGKVRWRSGAVRPLRTGCRA